MSATKSFIAGVIAGVIGLGALAWYISETSEKSEETEED